MRIVSSRYFQLLLLVSLSLSASAQSADLLLTNGKIFTSDEKNLYVQALAIKSNKILATGSNEVIEKLATAKTKRIDLQGKTVIPGFNDAHDHSAFLTPAGKFYTYSEMKPEGLSKVAVLDSTRRLVKESDPGEWIRGMIGVEVFFDTSMRAALDSIAPDNPVALQIWWGHGLTVNAKALKIAGLSDLDKDPVGGWYIRNGSNKISSLQQNAQAAMWIAVNKNNPDNVLKSLREYSLKQLPAGVTTVQFMGTGFDESNANEILRSANLSQRIRMIAWPRSTSDGRQLTDWPFQRTTPTSLTYLSGIKYVIDGTPMEQNALRTVPYPGKSDWYGRLNYPVDTIRQILKEALTTNQQLMMHITADSSFGLVLSTMKSMAGADKWRDKRVRIEHNCVGDQKSNISSENMQQLKDFGIILMHTSWYCMASPLRSLLDHGIILGIAPDGTTNPFLEIMLMTSTHSNPKENLTVEQAVIAYTKTNAYAEFKEKEKGTLTKGMLADLAVLSQDIFTIPAQQLPATKSVLTIVDGKIVYEQSNGAH